MSRPCRRCLYKGVQDECTADDSDLPQGSSAAQISPPALMQSPSSFSSSSLPSCESAASDTAGRGGGAGGSAYHRAEVGDLTAEESPKKGADGEECFEISLPELQVLSVSPALSRRYSTPYGGPAGSSFLLWIHDEDKYEIVNSMIRAAEDYCNHSVYLYSGTARLLVTRFTFAELHRCVLRVKATSATCISLQVSWDSSIGKWEQYMNTNQCTTLPTPIVRSFRAKMHENLLGSFSFDELRSTCCLYDYATSVSRSNGGGQGATQALMDHIITSAQSRALMQDWVGLRAASKFISRLLEFNFCTADARGTRCAGADAASRLIPKDANTLPDLLCHARLKLPPMLGGMCTSWLRLGQFSISGNPNASVMTDAEKLSLTLLVDCSMLDVVRFQRHAGSVTCLSRVCS